MIQGLGSLYFSEAENWAEGLTYLEAALRSHPELAPSLLELSRRVMQVARALPISAADVARYVYEGHPQILRMIREVGEVCT
jgi:predicted nuclease with RNAse H fold